MQVGDVVRYIERGHPTRQATVEAVAKNPSGAHELLALRLVKGTPISGFVAHLDDAGKYHWRYYE